jgi:hypothetical protein
MEIIDGFAIERGRLMHYATLLNADGSFGDVELCDEADAEGRSNIEALIADWLAAREVEAENAALAAELEAMGLSVEQAQREAWPREVTCPGKLGLIAAVQNELEVAL